MLKQFYEKNKLEVGLDEARLFIGTVCIAGNTNRWDPDDKIIKRFKEMF